jgi:hypothetical protein
MWYGAWRQYCFFPSEEMIFSSGCMQDIIKFIQNLMEEWRGKQAEKRRVALQDQG